MDFYFAFVYGSTYARTFWPLAKFFALIVTSYMHHKSVLTPVFLLTRVDKKQQFKEEALCVAIQVSFTRLVTIPSYLFIKNRTSIVSSGQKRGGIFSNLATPEVHTIMKLQVSLTFVLNRSIDHWNQVLIQVNN